MVSGLEDPSGGLAFVNGHDVVQARSSAQRSMGLCPQFDTLVERLTVRENLLLFGQLKGLQGAALLAAVNGFMGAMNIAKYQSKLIMQLSGGNRRKVSLAVALLGCPPTVYLDEPSTGLDPVASRLMWRLLSRISATKTTAIVLTTHNMLECEAVCSRICIMKLGEMVCLGDSQHLRSLHGTGFLLELSVEDPSSLAGAIAFVRQVKKIDLINSRT
jgi:ATP-binding cassette subfamily A (ABC1) protein 3